MDEDIKQVRAVLRGAISGGHDFVQVVNANDPNITDAERLVRQQVTSDARELLESVVDLGAVLATLYRAAQE